MKNIETRLEALEKEMAPPPATLDFEMIWRPFGEDSDITRITNYFPESEPGPHNRTWAKEPGESYDDFRQRVRSDVLANLLPGSNGALFYEHVTLGDDYESY